ncbi:MAG TPA: bifunctional YncE family protein/alkaline phosphatase family protein [Chthonomonadaceae bacterium]|nr:bifunctional YncE family protein/alkaline phosphatase family protein [Chthonomonadaceae bacterium]
MRPLPRILAATFLSILAGFSPALRADVPAGSLPTGPVPHRAGVWVLPNGRFITPAGKQTPLGNFPLGLAETPDGRYLIVVNNGAGRQSLQVVETVTGRVVQTQPVRTVFNGVVVSPDGRRVFAAGGGANAVLVFAFAQGKLTPEAPIPLAGYPTGLALARDGRTLYVTCNLARHVAIIDTARRAQAGEIPTGLFPFGIALTPNGRKAYVTNWSGGAVSVLDTQTRRLLKSIPTGGLPCAVVVVPNGRRVYVANANTDTVSVLNTATDTRLANISQAPYPHALYGSVPNGLALSPDGAILYVSLAGLNAVAAFSTRDNRRLGLYPVAWYPTGLICDGKTLYALSSKGTGSGSNADGRYIGHMINGLLSRLPVRPPARGEVIVARNNGYASRLSDLTPQPPLLRKERGRLSNHPADGKAKIPGFRTGSNANARSGLPAAIKHCVLIVRENRTYDQDLGDRKEGESFQSASLKGGRLGGDPALTMFGRMVTPNLHALANRFATGDNFYSDGEVSAQGHQWTLGANCPDYVEKTWMAYYSDRGRIRDSTYTPISYPASDWAIEHCARHGISCRMYGDPVRIDAHGRPLPLVADKVDTRFRGWDLGYPDVERAAEWKREFAAGIFPAFSYIWLPNDHTAGTQIGSKTPRALVADNDEATGMIVDAISHSKYWKETAIFLCEDDSQDGRDHVDAHRNILLVASPWARPGAVTSHHYSQASLYATIERLLRLPPMCQYDALAAPITDIWSSAPDLRPYQKIAALVPTDERNTAQSVMAAESARLDLDDADADKTGLLETILWRDHEAQRP